MPAPPLSFSSPLLFLSLLVPLLLAQPHRNLQSRHHLLRHIFLRRFLLQHQFKSHHFHILLLLQFRSHHHGTPLQLLLHHHQFKHHLLLFEPYLLRTLLQLLLLHHQFKHHRLPLYSILRLLQLQLTLRHYNLLLHCKRRHLLLPLVLPQPANPHCTQNSAVPFSKPLVRLHPIHMATASSASSKASNKPRNCPMSSKDFLKKHSFASLNHAEITALDDCRDLNNLNVDYLESVARDLKSANSSDIELVEKIEAYLSAVATTHYTCYDGLVVTKSIIANALAVPLRDA